ncbi:hypothetical protein [Brevundimonas sp. NPDC046655]|uniref:hypothetical protein n=1 Tax=unclassified Brevundimonas TaxID=2622653 RepID=UPI00384B321A
MVAGLSGCHSGPEQPVVTGALNAAPDCRPMVASVYLICWYGGRDEPLSQCEVGLEDPVGCGIGPEAVALFNGGVDVAGTFSSPGRPEQPRWVHIRAYRDVAGRIGRKWYPQGGREKDAFILEEKRFQSPPAAPE